MANSKQRQRRKRKTRGTQAGTIKKSRGNARPARGQSRSAPAKMTAAQRREQRASTPPSWKTAIKRGVLTAAFLFLVFVLLLKNSLAASLQFALLSALIYAPAFYFVDSFVYNRNQRRKARASEEQDKG